MCSPPVLNVELLFQWAQNKRGLRSNAMIFDYDNRAGIMVVERSLGRRTPCISPRPGIVGMRGRWSTTMACVLMNSLPSPSAPPPNAPPPPRQTLQSGVVCMSPTLGRWQLVNALPASNFAMPRVKHLRHVLGEACLRSLTI